MNVPVCIGIAVSMIGSLPRMLHSRQKFFFFKKHRESSDPLLCKNKDFVTNQPPLDRTLGSGYLQSLMSLAHSFFPSDSAQI